MNATSSFPSQPAFGQTENTMNGGSPNRLRAPPHNLARTTSRQFPSFAPNPNANPWSAPPTIEEGVPLYAPSTVPRQSHPETWGSLLNGGQWDANAFGGNPLFNGGVSTGNRMPPASRSRSALPQNWLHHSQSMAAIGSGFGPGQMMNGESNMNPGSNSLMDSVYENEEELIMTAIVIKNIPFAVRKEQIVSLMQEMGLPVPYAFNYHFDNGVFRGLAFANFTTADETMVVILNLNGYEIQGRKLRVEYKKMLPLQERERIERIKRERRGQLEEQHRPLGQPTQLLALNHQPSLASMVSVSSQPDVTGQGSQAGKPSKCLFSIVQRFRIADKDLDMNDPEELSHYLRLLTLSKDPNHEPLVLDPTLTPAQRRKIHEMAHHLNLMHVSDGQGSERRIHIFHPTPQPPSGQGALGSMAYANSQIPTARPSEGRRQNTVRAVTFEYNASEPGGAPRGPSSLLDIPGSPANGALNISSNLRGAKSVADLRSYTPSPVTSMGGYLPNASQAGPTVSVHASERSGPSAMNTMMSQLHGSKSNLLSHRDEDRLANGFGGLQLNTTGPAFAGGAASAASSESRSARGAFNFGGSATDTQPPIGTAIGGSAGSRGFGRGFGFEYKPHSATMAARSPGFPQPSRFGTGLVNGTSSRGILTNGSMMQGRNPSSSPESPHE